MFCIFLIKIWQLYSSCQNFNRIYSNNLEENDEEEKELIDIEFFLVKS